MSFDRNSFNQYLGHPLTLQRGELCSYQKRVASKKGRLDLVGETLALTPNHGFFLNASNQPVHFKRFDMNTKEQLKDGVDIPYVANKRFSSIVNEDYVLRHCVPKLTSEEAP
ncbi:hypothetical protein RYX36_035394 [Vicia faba]